MRGNSVLVSVIIPTYNRRELVLKCLQSLECQTYPQHLIEVIVVDDRSTDGTPEAVGAYCMENRALNVVYVTTNINGGPGYARNFGLAQATGDVVAFVDSDVTVSPCWISEAIRHFSEPSVCGVEGRTETDPFEVSCFTHQASNLKGGKYLTCNIFYRRTVLEQLNGFDPRFYDRRRKIHFREDTDLAFRALKLGYEIRFDPQVLAFHPPLPASFLSPVKDARRYMHDPYLFAKHGLYAKQHVDINRVAGISLKRPRQKLYSLSVLLFVSNFAAIGVPRLYTYTLGSYALSIVAVVILHCHQSRRFWSDCARFLPLGIVIPFVFAWYWACGLLRLATATRQEGELSCH